MNDIDTAAIRAAVQMQAASPVLMLRESVLALCDALDAARQDADVMGRAYDAASEERATLFQAVMLLRARAEAAEARAEEMRESARLYAKEFVEERSGHIAALNRAERAEAESERLNNIAAELEDRRDELIATRDMAIHHGTKSLLRAEAAEAELEVMTSRWADLRLVQNDKDAAEARIAAALELHPNPWQGECGDPEHCYQPGDGCPGCFEDGPCSTVRALTGGTE